MQSTSKESRYAAIITLVCCVAPSGCIQKSAETVKHKKRKSTRTVDSNLVPNRPPVVARGVSVPANTSVMSAHEAVRTQLDMPQAQRGTMRSSAMRASPRSYSRPARQTKRTNDATSETTTHTPICFNTQALGARFLHSNISCAGWPSAVATPTAFGRR